MKINEPITTREVLLGELDNLLTTTDLKGAITYTNKDFVRISGFAEAEMLGKNHNIIRHPHMPPQAFKELWETIRAGRSWMGLVKNRCKNGDFYWVSAYVTPISRDGKTVEYQSVRTQPPRHLVAAASNLYDGLSRGEQPLAMRLPVLSLFARISIGLGLLISMMLLAMVSLADMFIGGALACAGLLQLVGMSGLYVLLAPLRALQQRAKGIANNPLGQFLYTGRRDEFGRIGFAMDMLGAESSALVGRMADAAQRLKSQAAELVDAVQHNSEGNQRQQQETDQVATAIEEMAASVLQVASNAQDTARAAHSADGETREGSRMVSASRDLMHQLASDIREASESVTQLAGHSNAITQVVDVISAVAQQTNLLALNAAIEAARAGEQGRGFAVVADEVRGLASRTQQSTTSIQEMIQSLQASAGQAVEIMSKSIGQAARSVDEALRASESLDGINLRVTAISDSSAQIAAAVEQQSAVSEEINRSIVRIRQVSDDNATATLQSDQTARQMAGLAQGLESLVHQFWSSRRQRS
ncbi:MAG: chemotaxis protein [Gammaproteobacteria bacterium HGW-Gammaproteobacteria-11]|nr:MAG: chemotaxis protein [Gammaproteobacteria bacterium HGW-Gammaproteobacteria-11]